MDMPNTQLLRHIRASPGRKRRAGLYLVANYGFVLGVSNDNLDIVAALDPREVLVSTMGASTGNMLQTTLGFWSGWCLQKADHPLFTSNTRRVSRPTSGACASVSGTRSRRRPLADPGR